MDQSQSLIPSVVLMPESAVYIMSHKLFSEAHYENRLRQHLRLMSSESKGNVILDFMYIQLGTFSVCNASADGDTLRLLQDHGSDQLFSCAGVSGPFLPRAFINASSATYITLEFKTNDIGTYDGFLLRYTGTWLQKL